MSGYTSQMLIDNLMWITERKWLESIARHLHKQSN